MRASRARRCCAALVTASALVIVLTPRALAGDDDSDAALRLVTRQDTDSRVERRSATSAAAPSSDSSARSRSRRKTKRAETKSIHGTDDRSWISNPAVYPWRTVCKVYADSPDGVYVWEGSAILIAPDAALTAAHVVYDAEAGGWATSARVVPGFDGTDEPYGSAYVSRFFSWNHYTQQGDSEWDMALLKLDSRIGDQTGWLGYRAPSDTDLGNAIVNTAGYPADKAEFYGIDYMWRAYGTLFSYSPETMKYAGTLDTYEGQSGSGLWLDYSASGGDRYVIGVHREGDALLNYGTRISRVKVAYLNAWMAGYDGPPDLRAVSVTTGLTTPLEPGQSESVDVTVANDGDAPATSTVSLYFVHHVYNANGGTLLGSAPLTLAPGATAALRFPVTVPTAFADASPAWQFVARVNEDRSVIESDDTDHANNESASSQFALRPAWEPLAIGAKRVLRLSRYPFNFARAEVEVTDSSVPLLIRLRGRKGQLSVRRPDGSTFVIDRASVETAPQAGTWRLELSNLSNKKRRFAVEVKPTAF